MPKTKNNNSDKAYQDGQTMVEVSVTRKSIKSFSAWIEAAIRNGGLSTDARYWAIWTAKTLKPDVDAIEQTLSSHDEHAAVKKAVGALAQASNGRLQISESDLEERFPEYSKMSKDLLNGSVSLSLRPFDMDWLEGYTSSALDTALMIIPEIQSWGDR
jgi:hypothetical protein